MCEWKMNFQVVEFCQMKNNFNIEERTTFYSSKVISQETKRGADYSDINKVIMINILGYNLIQVAKKLLDLGVEISNIIEATGLSKEEIEKLQKDKWI